MNFSLEDSIITHLKNGDKIAINLLYENYADALFGVIKKVISDDDLAQDVLQETLIKVWKKVRLFFFNNLLINYSLTKKV